MAHDAALQDAVIQWSPNDFLVVQIITWFTYVISDIGYHGHFYKFNIAAAICLKWLLINTIIIFRYIRSYHVRG